MSKIYDNESGRLNVDALIETLPEEKRLEAIESFENINAKFNQELENMTLEEQKQLYKNIIYAHTPFVRRAPRISRNDLCFCGSGKKYKNCCMKDFEEYINNKEFYDKMRRMKEAEQKD